MLILSVVSTFHCKQHLFVATFFYNIDMSYPVVIGLNKGYYSVDESSSALQVCAEVYIISMNNHT